MFCRKKTKQDACQLIHECSNEMFIILYSSVYYFYTTKHMDNELLKTFSEHFTNHKTFPFFEVNTCIS